MSLITAIQPTYASGIPTPTISALINQATLDPVGTLSQYDDAINVFCRGSGYTLLSRVYINGVIANPQTHDDENEIFFQFPVPTLAEDYEITVRTPGVPESNAVPIHVTPWSINDITGTDIRMANWYKLSADLVVQESISGGRFAIVSTNNQAIGPDPVDTQLHNTVDGNNAIYKATHTAFDGQGCMIGSKSEARWMQSDEHGSGTSTTMTQIVVGFPATIVAAEAAVLYMTCQNFSSGNATKWNGLLAPDDGLSLYTAYDGVGGHFANLTAPTPAVNHDVACVYMAEFVGTTSSAFYINHLATPRVTGLSVANRLGPVVCFAYYNLNAPGPSHLQYPSDGAIAEFIAFEGIADEISKIRTANYLFSKYPSTGVSYV